MNEKFYLSYIKFVILIKDIFKTQNLFQVNQSRLKLNLDLSDERMKSVIQLEKEVISYQKKRKDVIGYFENLID